MKKKIAIVTWLGWGNFGTSLQSYALHHKLEMMGYDVCYLLKLGAVNSLKALVRSCLPRFVKQGILARVLRDPRMYTEPMSPVERKRARFDSEHYNIRPVSSLLPKWRLRRDIDLFITGSDQIWNTHFTFDPFYFLHFAGRKKRVAYASSIGCDSVHPQYADRVKTLLSKFAHIGVREQVGVEVLQSLTARTDIQRVPDPTFLLSAADWGKMAQSAELEIELPQRYLLAYFVGDRPEYPDWLKEVGAAHQIEHIILLPSHESGQGKFDDVQVCPNAGPKEFVRLIQDAALVCTDSFHALCISLSFSKEFVAFKRFRDDDSRSQNSRIYDLLSRFDLQSRLYPSGWATSPTSESGVNEKMATSHVDFQLVAKIVEEERRMGEAFLTRAIEH